MTPVDACPLPTFLLRVACAPLAPGACACGVRVRSDAAGAGDGRPQWGDWGGGRNQGREERRVRTGMENGKRTKCLEGILYKEREGEGEERERERARERERG